MKCTFFLLSIGLSLWAFLSVSASYDSGPGYGVSHSSYPAAPLAHGHSQGWGSGHSAGSYYHYHVPLVGQNSHYQAHPPAQSNDHHLYLLLPLLLLAGLPLLLLPLLPLLLLPLGLSLLALLLPLLMMGGMMMMMMMGGGMMMMPMMRTPGGSGSHNFNGEARDFGGFGFGHLILHDISMLMSRYARSLDLDACPERIACEAGSFIFPDNATESVTARTVMNFIVEQATPKGKARKILRGYKQAFWTGSKTGSCLQFTCQPTFRIFTNSPPPPPPPTSSQSSHFPYSSSPEHGGVNHNQAHHNGTVAGSSSAKSNFPYADYYNLYEQQQKNQTAANLQHYHNYYYSNPTVHGGSGFPTYVQHQQHQQQHNSERQTGENNFDNNFYAGYNTNYSKNVKKPAVAAPAPAPATTAAKVDQHQQQFNSWTKSVNGQFYDSAAAAGGAVNSYAENEIRSMKS